MPTSCPWQQGTGASGNKDILRRTESSPLGICAWLGICTAQSFSLCAGGVSSILSPPTSSPPQSQREHLQSLSYPELSVPCSCSSSSWHESEQGWGKAGLSWPFLSTALCVPQATLGHQLSPSCAQGHICHPMAAQCAQAGSRSILVVGLAEDRAQTYLSAGQSLRTEG